MTKTRALDSLGSVFFTVPSVVLLWGGEEPMSSGESSRECPCCHGRGTITDAPPLVWIYEEGTERLLWAGDIEIIPGIGSYVKLLPVPPKVRNQRRLSAKPKPETHVMIGLEDTAEHRHRIELVAAALSDPGFGGC